MMIRGAVIEGPVWDAKFYGEWLLAAAQADTLWKECLSDPDFENKVSRIGVRSNPDFGITAIVMLNWLGGRRPRFVINVDGDEGEDFVLMAGMGFFIPKYQTYRLPWMQAQADVCHSEAPVFGGQDLPFASFSAAYIT